MIYILIDFDNFFDYKPADPDFDWLEFELNQLISRVLKSNSRPEFISFRLLWRMDGKRLSDESGFKNPAESLIL